MQSAALRWHDASLSGCLSVGDQDHTGWKSWKLIARTISPTPLLFVAQRPPSTPGGPWGNFLETSSLPKFSPCSPLQVGREKVAFFEHKSGNISETRKDRGKVNMEGLYRNLTTLFPTVPFPIHYTASSSPTLQSIISQERVKLRTSNLARIITGYIPIKNFGQKGNVGVSRDCQIFRLPPVVSRVKLRTSNVVRTFLSAQSEQKPIKISQKVAAGYSRTQEKFSGHPYIGRIVRSSLQ